MTELISRRSAFRLVTVAGGAIASFCLAGISRAENPAPDSGKQLTKQAAQYRDQPNGQQHCSVCSNYFAPSGCRLVAGSVSPSGWCPLFQPKSL
jgi:hypothetical protein